VVEHHSDPPNPWDGYRLCLTDLPDCSHVLVLQDDAIPVPGFWDAVERIADAQPDRPVCLWMSAIPSNAAARALRARGSYIPLGPAPFVPLVAVLWPTRQASAFARWAETASRLTRADDGNVARWMKASKTEFMVAVPSICEHDDFTPSVKGGSQKASGGKDRTRRALLLAKDASRIQW
jgi:hypothetical protein